jgi:hypothetical protein
MKTQNQHKVKKLSAGEFVSKALSKVAKEDASPVAFDKNSFFDTDWGYSYLMDYLSLLKKKKRIPLPK